MQHLLLITIVLMLLCITGCTDNSFTDDVQTPPDKAWRELSSVSQRYYIQVLNDPTHVPAGKLHNWNLNITANDGAPLKLEQFAFSATMPGHGHGMATKPQWQASATAGHVILTGVQFQMYGEWQVLLSIDSEAGPDTAQFSFVSSPASATSAAPDNLSFDAAELALIRSLSIASLPELKPDRSNRFSLNPAAAELGEQLFNEPGLSKSGNISCATCHQSELFFTDGLQVSVGSRATKRHAPGLIGAAYSSWFYWDGRRDSLWSQALSPIETPGEMDNTRVSALRFLLEDSRYADNFRQLTGVENTLLDGIDLHQDTGPLGDEDAHAAWRLLSDQQQDEINHAFANLGKIIAAYEETLSPAASRFDQFAAALLDGDAIRAGQLMNAREVHGLRLFISTKTDCLRCHNGPQFSNREFHNIATSKPPDGVHDFGRKLGLRQVRRDEFNCLGRYSDASPEQCRALRYVQEGHLDSGAFKTPTLRNVANTAPYMHHGAFADLEAVLEHYRSSPTGPREHHELPGVTLTDDETQDLIAFLRTL